VIKRQHPLSRILARRHEVADRRLPLAARRLDELFDKYGKR
jgi:hypothetical protein